MRGVSIIVCCYNSARRLPTTLKHIASQRVSPDVKWELIIIDNASTDETHQVARDEWENYKVAVSFRIVREEKAGLSHARNRGISEASYSYLIFCDDDNWLNDDYVSNAFHIMEQHPEAGAIGGNAKPAFENQPVPEWFETFKKHFAVGAQGVASDGVEDLGDKQRYVFGAAAVFRKEALDALRQLNHGLICSDRRAGRLLSGGDNELCYCLILLGYRIFYAPALVFQHFMPSDRLTVDYLLKLNFGAGYSQAMLLSYAPFLSTLPEKKTRWYFQLAVNLFAIVRSCFVERYVKGRPLLQWKVSARKRMGAIVGLWKERRRISLQIERNHTLAKASFSAHRILK